MSDPLRSDSPQPIGAASSADRDAKIEQLLLAGLDHYFAGHYDHAINVWTRVLFFDRGQTRARAYIERARRAQAERQRESEELLHTGTAAYRNGDLNEARRLLQAAVDAGAPLELAFPMLERLHRTEPMPALVIAPHANRVAPTPVRESAVVQPLRGRRTPPLLLAGLAIAAGVGIAALLATRADWRVLVNGSGSPAPASLAPPVREAILAVPTRGEMALERARRLAGAGALHDALSTLDLVRSTDPQRADADELRGQIQRQLLRLDHP